MRLDDTPVPHRQRHRRRPPHRDARRRHGHRRGPARPVEGPARRARATRPRRCATSADSSLTHGDSDHIGFAERLRVEAGVPVYVHAADADRARGGDKPKAAMPPMKLGPTIGFFAYAPAQGRRPDEAHHRGRRGRRRRRARPARCAADHRSARPLAGQHRGPLRPSRRRSSSGDALTTRHVTTGRTGAQPAPFTDDPPQALASLDRLADIDAEWVLPGHGAPWRGSPASAAEAVRRAA